MGIRHNSQRISGAWFSYQASSFCIDTNQMNNNINQKTNTMKSFYKQPVTAVAEWKMENQLLAGSPAGPAGAPGVNASREGYGTGSSEIWD